MRDATSRRPGGFVPSGAPSTHDPAASTVARLTLALFLVTGVPTATLTTPLAAQQHGGHHSAMEPDAHAEHAMPRVDFAGGWTLAGMGQLFPIVSFGFPTADSDVPAEDLPFAETGWHLTQPVAMINLESPGSRFVVRLTPNFEKWTLEEGEVTLGGWGEGFLDARHPHTVLHEAMASLNFFDVGNGWDLSLSGGKGFAPYGTDDPMARPVLKYPTNHHLSQILERWTVNGIVHRSGWMIEGGVFGGTEPESPTDLSNIDSFGNSWSLRATRLQSAFGGVFEVALSYADVTEEHGDREESKVLRNAKARFEGPLAGGRLYALVEASDSDPDHGEAHDDGHAHGDGGSFVDDEGYFSVLAEAQWTSGSWAPYGRIEWATRPEYPRRGGLDDPDGFFRYDIDAEPVGATEWVIGTVGVGYRATTGTVSVRPFVEAQRYAIDAERGGIIPSEALGTEEGWTLSLGARVFFGGGPMRMGGYGLRDAMTRMLRPELATLP